MLWLLIRVALYALAVVVFLMLYFLEHWVSPRRYRLIQKIPGPKGDFYLGNARELNKLQIEDLLIWLADNLKVYKRIMKIWILGQSNVYINDADDAQVILNSKHHLKKGAEYNFICNWLDEGLLTSTGDKWFLRRKLLTPAFHFKILEDNLTVFNRNAKILCNKLTELKGQDLPLEKLITLCTLDVIIETSMGINIKAQEDSGQKYVKEIKRISNLIIYRLIRYLLQKDWIFKLTSTGRQYWKTINFLHDFSDKVIGERKASYNDKNTFATKKENTNSEVKIRRALLDTLLEIEKNNPGSLSDKDIREEVDTFMFEGHDTTSAALIYIFFNLAKYPEVQGKVAAELFEIFGESSREATSNDLHNMTYLEMVIKESLRMFPSVPYISRTIEQDLILDGGVIIPAPTNVVIPIYIIHRNEKYWPNPDQFDPERFSEEQVQGRHPYAFIPFSAGQRNCIGQKFAMMELKVIVSTVLRNLKVIPVTTEEEIKFFISLVLRTKEDILCRFESR